MAIEIKDGAGLAGLASVDSEHNLNVALPQSIGKAGYARILASDGSAIDTTENNYLRVSSSNLLFYDQVDGAAVNTNLWSPSVSTMTITQAGGFLNLNAGASVVGAAYAILTSVKSFPMYGTLPMSLEVVAKIANIPEANATVEIGIGAVSGASAPTDGAFFRWTPAGQFICVLNNAGAETATASLSGTITDADTGKTVVLPPPANVIHLYGISIAEDHVLFTVDDVLVADIPTPTGQSYPFNAGRQPVCARVYNGGSSPSLAPLLYVGAVILKQEDLNQLKAWDEQLASIGRGAYQSQVTPFAQNSNHANSTSPVSATLSNTAAGYATLGGRFQFAAVASAATDFALFGFQVPAGYQLFVKSIGISTLNTGAIGSAITPTIMEWGIGVNASAISLATVDGAGTWSPRRIPLGMQSFGLAAVIGALASDILRRFQTPLVVDSGRFLHVILQVPLGAATSSQIFRGVVVINGYFE